MKEEEILSLRKNGVDHKRIESLKKSLKGYNELKKELRIMERLVLKKDEEIKNLMEREKKSNKKKLVEGLK